MDRLTLSRIDEQLESSEVAALCFLCRDFVNRKRLEGITDAKDLFLRLEDKLLLDNPVFLCQLLRVIHRMDLFGLLETDSMRYEETDACRTLSNYRVMLYNIYEDMTEENLDKMKFLMSSKLGRRTTEACKTALDLFAEMEKAGLLSKTNLGELWAVLKEFDQQLALTVQHYMNTEVNQQDEPHVTMDHQRVNINSQPAQPLLSISETQPSNNRERTLSSDAEPSREHTPVDDELEVYALDHNPRGLCVVINNEVFFGPGLKHRAGTQADVDALRLVFTRLGFKMVIHNNLTADDIRLTLKDLGTASFVHHDALVVCVLSHGEKGCVYGTDEEQVSLQELTKPFRQVRTLAGKPKLFFIQACQGALFQRGSQPCPPHPKQKQEAKLSSLEDDAGPVDAETVPWDADFLLGMATVPEHKSFRNTTTGSIYIQELCRQLERSAGSTNNDDILTVLTRVNREVSKGDYLTYKQMPEPKYTLTKKLILKFVS